MIKQKVNKPLIKICIVCIISLMTLALIMGAPATVFAQEEDQGLIIETSSVGTSTVTNVKNISGYLNSNSKLRISKANKVDTVLRALQFSEDEISNMSEDYRQSFNSVTDAKVSSESYVIESSVAENSSTQFIHPTQDESTFNQIHKLKITVRALRDGTAETPTQTYTAFRIISSVEFDKSNFYNPQLRYKDYLGFYFSNDAVVLGGASGYFTCDVHNMWTKKYKSTSTSYLPSKEVKEYPSGVNWGLQFDLPGNSLANGYTNFRLGGEIRIGTTTNFNLYTSYAHSTLDASVSMSSDGNAGITFSGGATDNSPTPVLFVVV